jgi:two-component system cell cycle response regulator
MGSDTQFPERLTRVSFASVLPSGPDRPCLVVIAGAELGQSVELDRDELQIGRGDHVVRDENSTNGTYVNDQRVTGSVALSDGDQIKIGRTVIKYTRSPLEVGYLEHVMGLATHDALTGAFNKRRFDDAFPAEVARASSGKRPLSLVLFDIDFFKSINDGYGHSAGDAVLRELTTVARSCIDDADLLARVGGEEFAILIPSALDTAREKAERLRSAVAGHAFEWDRERIPVTISLGVAELASGEEPQKLYSRADMLLYISKGGGRNRVSS